MADFINTLDVVGDKVLTDSIIDGSVVEYKDNTIQTLGALSFASCKLLKTVDCPAVTSLSNNVFWNDTSLESASFPSATRFGTDVFNGCSALMSVNVSKCTDVTASMFYTCGTLPMIEFDSIAAIRKTAFASCLSLTALIIRGSSVGVLVNTNAFQATPIASGTGYIYVPAALIDSYKIATNWSTFANQLRALEDYTVDGTVTGELDTTKI